MGIMVESNLPEALLERWLQSERALDAFVDHFLASMLSRAEWTHRAHVGVGAALVLREGKDAAVDRLRRAIPQLNLAHGVEDTENSGYHETLTVFWVERIAGLLHRLPGHFSPLDRVRVVVEAYGGIRRLDRAYYSYDVLSSPEARRTWFAPDR